MFEKKTTIVIASPKATENPKETDEQNIPIIIGGKDII
jgi:hypothetical protein